MSMRTRLVNPPHLCTGTVQAARELEGLPDSPNPKKQAALAPLEPLAPSAAQFARILQRIPGDQPPARGGDHYGSLS